MVLTTRDGHVYKVHFRHYLPCKPTPIKGKGLCRAVATFLTTPNRKIFSQVFVKRPMTQCFIHEGHCGVRSQDCLAASNFVKRGPLFLGEARCSPRDTFLKTLGRRIALGRALDLAVKDPSVRLELLAHYFVQIKPHAPCHHRRKDGSTAWVAMEGFNYCSLCHARVEKSVDL